ncbi:c6 zinc finger domain containing protein [Grosmannia clavigera kw1407]|uniref:C6 zinc finger domain containing protein n=1 Tax=Grosmannia clavigera (strain kw1407 / UAMH 11150) TaxID=655863 RepID=F0XNC7_GROCL|nr:c6 zinc finger domain containing protein [Grosmannia clavigera kw1407]EFX00853.1 c6 zinc finger domain containing protein [Grosmannia clavigera kw1407]
MRWPRAVRDMHGLRRLESNSGAAFVRRLGLKIDPARAPKLNLFGWNVGERQLSMRLSLSASTPVLSVVEITSQEHVQALAQFYFDKVDPCYGFLNGRVFADRLDRRFRQQQQQQQQAPAEPDVYDSVIAGVAALGCLFSQGAATLAELQLVRTAFHALHAQRLAGPPGIDLITGWALRTVYLRLTDSPYAVWMASCTLMHLVEASGLHGSSAVMAATTAVAGEVDLAEPENSGPGSPPGDGYVDPVIAARLLGIAHHLHVWTSFDLGLTRVAFLKTDLSLPPLWGQGEPEDEPSGRGEAASATRPSAAIGDATAELLGLLPMSVDLDPARPRDAADLTATLGRLLAGTHTLAPSVLAQCNLVLCLLRRFHTQHLDVAPELEARVLALLRRGLACARDMVLSCSPWHQASNVPFQTICMLLVLDTRSSLALLPEAMQTLGLVASVYDTDRMREAHSAARLLVRLHQQRRRDDLAVLGNALQRQSEPPVLPVPAQSQTHLPQSHTETPSQPHIQPHIQPHVQPHTQPQPLPQQSLPLQLDLGPSEEEFSWLGALVSDLPGLQRVDLEQFLSTDLIDDPSLMGL